MFYFLIFKNLGIKNYLKIQKLKIQKLKNLWQMKLKTRNKLMFRKSLRI